ncbi:MAG: PadR family transcriptional regulator [Thaumarchaeota archaeon]|nr:PadR family transcriptional regulator [Nitrososphaerota archaeon]
MWPFRFGPHRKRGLRMMVLTILRTSPKNGVEIMDGIESMTRGWWRPSPGSIYPLLKQLDEDGLVKAKDDGRYQLTAKASEGLETSFGPRFRRPQTVDDMMNEMSGFVSYAEDLSKSRSSDLRPHLAKLRALSRRLADIAGEGESESPS